MLSTLYMCVLKHTSHITIKANKARRFTYHVLRAHWQQFGLSEINRNHIYLDYFISSEMVCVYSIYPCNPHVISMVFTITLLAVRKLWMLKNISVILKENSFKTLKVASPVYFVDQMLIEHLLYWFSSLFYFSYLLLVWYAPLCMAWTCNFLLIPKPNMEPGAKVPVKHNVLKVWPIKDAGLLQLLVVQFVPCEAMQAEKVRGSIKCPIGNTLKSSRVHVLLVDFFLSGYTVAALGSGTGTFNIQQMSVSVTSPNSIKHLECNMFTSAVTADAACMVYISLQQEHYILMEQHTHIQL